MCDSFPKRLHIVSLNSVDTAVCQGVFCQLLAFFAFVFISIHIIRKRPFTLSVVPFTIHRAVALQGGKSRSYIRTNSITALAPACNYINYIGNAFAITNAGVVYKVYLGNILWIESQHLLFAYNNAIYSQLNATSVINSSNSMADVVNTNIGKCEFLKNAVTIVRSLLLCIGRIDNHTIGLVDYLGSFHRYFFECDRFLHILRMGKGCR